LFLFIIHKCSQEEKKKETKVENINKKYENEEDVKLLRNFVRALGFVEQASAEEPERYVHGAQHNAHPASKRGDEGAS
jgi:hypothetical protein